MKEIRKVYLSGKITGTDDYLERFNLYANRLKAQGYTVIDPARVNSNMPSDTTWNEYMKMAFTLLSQADTIYMMPGWEESHGATAELAFAWKYHKNIIFSEGLKDGEF